MNDCLLCIYKKRNIKFVFKSLNTFKMIIYICLNTKHYHFFTFLNLLLLLLKIYTTLFI